MSAWSTFLGFALVLYVTVPVSNSSSLRCRLAIVLCLSPCVSVVAVVVEKNNFPAWRTFLWEKDLID